jgi:hypothetical protein
MHAQKQLELDRLRAELGGCRAALEAARSKEQALTARKRLLEKEACRRTRSSLLPCHLSSAPSLA